MSDQLIFTKDGMISSDLLEITDVVEWHDNFRVVATEWRLKSEYQRFDGLDPETKEPTYTTVPAGELVRRDVNANCLRGMSMSGAQANL